MTNNPNSYIWEHLYKPKHIKDMILPAEYKNFFQKIIDDNAAVNILLESNTPGTGKTASSEALANDLGCTFLKINASAIGGIDTVRSQCTEFAQTMSFDGSPKMILLDEADRLSMDAQQALRGIIDELSDNCRFILTCNYVNKIIPALRGDDGGRTITLKFEMHKPEYKEEVLPQVFNRITGILKHQNIPYDENVIKQLIDLKYPSIRTIIAKLQGYSMMKGKIDEGIISSVNIGDKLKQLILSKNITDAMNYIHENNLSYADVFSYIKSDLIPYKPTDNLPYIKKKGEAYMNLADYEYRAAFSSDPDIQIIACLVSMISCIG